MTHKRLDYTEEFLQEALEVGKTYKLGLAQRVTFCRYVIVKVHEVIQHGAVDTIHSYLVEGDTNGYLWSAPYYRNFPDRIVSAEEIVV